jgi:DNA-binding MarR family transcriptional regulator
VYKWNYVPNGDKTQVSYEKADNMDVFHQHLEDGLDSAAEIAEEMGVTKGYVSKLAKRAADEGWLLIFKGKYKLKDSY